MKFSKLILFGALIFFIQCTPKVAEEMTKVEETVEQVVNEVKEPFRSMAPAAGPARKINMGEFNVFDLANGLKVIVVENHKLPRVSYSLSLKNQQINEKDKAGMVSFMGSLLGSGTKTKTKAEIDKAKDYIGANLSAFGSGMFGSSLTKHQDKLLDLMSDMLYNPSWPKEEFDKILKQNLSGIETVKTDPNSMASNVRAVVNYGTDHPYGEIETAETYQAITIDDCKKYYETFFKPNNAYLTIVGDISPEQAKATAEKYFGSWKKGDVPSVMHDMPSKPEGAQVAFAHKEGAVQSVINITYPLDYKIGDPDMMAGTVMNSILGGGIFSGRLMQNLREDKAFTYGARSSLSSSKMVGNFNAYASVRTEVTDSSLVEFFYELERMTSEMVNDDDLQLTKNSLGGSFARSLESPQTLARFARNIEEYGLPVDYYETYLERLEAVNKDDVMRVAKRFITPNNANVVIVGNKDEIGEKVAKFDSDGEIDYYDAFGKKLEMNDSALPPDVNEKVVIADYINAIGGKGTLDAVKTLDMTYGTEMMGMALDIRLVQKAPDKFYMKMGNAQMVIQEQKFNGTKAYSGGMQGAKTFTEGKEFDAMKGESVMFEQMQYDTDAYTLELKGLDNVDGEACYKVTVENAAGDSETQYYGVKNNLLLRSISTIEAAPGQTMQMTTDYSDYKEVNGVMMPHKMTQSGPMLPAPMVMEAKEIKINDTVDDALFNIE